MFYYEKLIVLSFTLFLSAIVNAGELDDLSGLSDVDESSNEKPNFLNSASDTLLQGLGEQDKEESTESANSIQFSGYVKPLAYWGSRNFSSDTWGWLTARQADGITIPQSKESSGFAAIGSRFQFRMEGYIGTSARLFSVVNIDYNEVVDSSETKTRLIESYIELFSKDVTWKIGNQLVTWGYMEGIEVPTDRVNAFDYAYGSTEYEDAKMASTGILYQRSFSQFSGLDLMIIPAGKVNNDTPDQDRLFSQNNDNLPVKDETNIKSAIRYYFTEGNLDLALSYVDGTDPRADVALLGSSPNQSLQRSYHRERSPGIDLQYNFGSVLGKIAYAEHYTNDTDGSDPSIKNSWKHLAVGAEFNIGSSIANLYVGTKYVDNFNDSTNDRMTTNILMGQGYEQVNFISGHIISNFLTGNALTTTLLFASYWNNTGDLVQYIVKPTLTYKMADSLQLQFSPSLMNVTDTLYQLLQLEVKYSF